MSVKKVTIEKKDLPPLSTKGEYLIRYRIISEDKNRTSHWSPIYTLDATRVWDPEEQEFKSLIRNVTSNAEVTPSDVIVTWGDVNGSSSYDIFFSLKVSGIWQPYSHKGTSTSHSYSFVRPNVAGATHIRIAIQLGGIEKIISPLLTISTTEKSLQPVISGGSA